MASDDKTEKPTGKRLQEARKKGQIAKSQDLGGALVFGLSMTALSMIGPGVVNNMAGAMRAMFGLAAHPGEVSSGAGLSGVLGILEHVTISSMAPIAAVCVGVGILANVLQMGGIRIREGAFKPDFKRINPVSGAKNLFGPNSLFETGKALVKVLVVGAVVAITLLPMIGGAQLAVGTSPRALGSLIGSSVLSIAQRAALAYLLIGLVDYIHQRRKIGKTLKMTKQEVKDEYKQQNTSAEVKGAIRRRQMQAARARMMSAIPDADVVVTNPTHFAVALKYDGKSMAPVVVAKGVDHVAAQIRRIAAENDVPLFPDPPLARQMYRDVEIGQMIPAELYAAVAGVLAFVYRLSARRKVAV